MSTGGPDPITSGGATAPGRPKRAPWTLRRRLMVVVVGLLALGSLIVGFASAVSVGGLLTEGVDRQLTKAAERAVEYGHSSLPLPTPGSLPSGGGYGGGDSDRTPPSFIALPGLGPGSLGAIVVGDTVVNAGYLDPDGGTVPCTESQDAIILSVVADEDPTTIDLGEGLGEYRVVAATDSSGATRVVGLPLDEVTSTVTQLVTLIAVISVVVLLLAGLAAFAIVRYSLRPLDRVVATAAVVAELPLDRGEVALAVRVPDSDTDPRTEVGRVGAAINRMLDHVASALAARQASENRVRRFVADASHELRTPLTSIRGYAELTRRSNKDLPPEVVHSIGRVESEAVRMTTLVEDLLLLARLDEGRDLELTETDLTRVVIDAVSDARAAGQDHEWSLDLPEEPVLVIGDGGRLHQVLANLLSNARVHTPAGTHVTTALAIDGQDAVVTVADDGPGIPESLQPTLFERFSRGDGSRSRAAGSTGLGLAIVQAVVEGHGGAVTVQSEPGKTVFTVRLPLAQDAG